MTEENADRVRANTSDEVNAEIDREMEMRVQSYADVSREEITPRINKLKQKKRLLRFYQENR